MVNFPGRNRSKSEAGDEPKSLGEVIDEGVIGTPLVPGQELAEGEPSPESKAAQIENKKQLLDVQRETKDTLFEERAEGAPIDVSELADLTEEIMKTEVELQELQGEKDTPDQ